MNGLAIRPPIDAMKTIVPGALRIRGRNAWVTATWPTRFTSSTLRRTSRSMVSTGPPSPTPGVVDQPDQTVLADRALDLVLGRLDRALLGHVDRDRGEPVRALLGQRLGVGLLADAREHAVTLLVEEKRGGATDSRRSPGDHDCATFVAGHLGGTLPKPIQPLACPAVTASVLAVVGARPNFVKSAPVIAALEQVRGHLGPPPAHRPALRPGPLGRLHRAARDARAGRQPRRRLRDPRRADGRGADRRRGAT